jgi:hypothetical protein
VYTAPDLPGENANRQVGWYDAGVIRTSLTFDYDLILIDGPNGSIGRGGFLKHLELFNTAVPMIFDDIQRPAEHSLMERVSEKIGRPYFILDRVTGYIL